MDPLTQGLLGATLPHSLATDKKQLKVAASLGFLSGMAADLDVLIRSTSDPILFLEYHRQFTHSLVFIPLGGLLCALIAWGLIGKKLPRFSLCWLYCTLGYATHALLDACTSYGTQLLWPFDNTRVAWNIISVIDPLYTLPLLFLLLAGLIKGSRVFTLCALLWAFTYPVVGLLQHQRVELAATKWAEDRGINLTRIEAKPSFANLLVWKIIFETATDFHTIAIRAGKDMIIYPGESVNKLSVPDEFPQLLDNPLQLNDIERFRTFSNGFLAVDPDNRNRIFDVRYSLLPNQIQGLWGIEVTTENKQQHVRYYTNRAMTEQQVAMFKAMLMNRL